MLLKFLKTKTVGNKVENSIKHSVKHFRSSMNFHQKMVTLLCQKLICKVLSKVWVLNFSRYYAEGFDRTLSKILFLIRREFLGALRYHFGTFGRTFSLEILDKIIKKQSLLLQFCRRKIKNETLKQKLERTGKSLLIPLLCISSDRQKIQ